MTSAHILPKGCSIFARRQDENDFPYEVDILHHKLNWDIALLHIKGVHDSCYGRLARDRSLNVAQMLLYIHPYSFVGSFLVGKVAFQCVDDVVLPTGTQTCQTYLSTALQSIPRYRIIGDVWNSHVFENFETNVKWTFEKSLHPLVPLIQIYGFVFGESSSGGPVFNTEGEIMGMLSMGSGGFDIAIHVSLLRQVMREKEEHLNIETLERKDTRIPGNKEGRVNRLKEHSTKPRGDRFGRDKASHSQV
ncbi:uncharacterized protein LOC110613158 [Manihot esculenta]|uniref:uncharacterized protein LOC110613158 n=1 Tax=Manihot esculenta TaxID=3983 RepID=UPI001CC4BD53|nr:uncharacterized protein LOC110613158 [Manihot esculenta]